MGRANGRGRVARGCQRRERGEREQEREEGREGARGGKCIRVSLFIFKCGPAMAAAGIYPIVVVVPRIHPQQRVKHL